MVRDQRRRGFRIGHDDAGCVVAGDGLAAGRRDVDDGNGVAARITRGIRIHAEQRDQPHVEARLLARFAHRGMLDRLADVHEAARQGMAKRRMGAPDDHDRTTRAVLELDDDVRRDFRRAWTRHQATGTAGRAR